jgi:hypothetical protein
MWGNLINKSFCVCFAVVLSLSWSVAGHTQETQETQQTQDSADTAAPDGNVSQNQIIALIANEVILAPGIGLRNIRLGEPLEEVENRLGPPAKILKKGILRTIYTLIYQLDSGTEVALVGRSQVERIVVNGNSAALVRTAQGARFGMNRSLIQRIYKSPTKSKKDRLEYRNLGATFYFAGSGNSGVTRIDLYPRRN